MGRALALALASMIALAACSYDTCAGTSCGDPCWICTVGDPECGTDEPDGSCQPDGSCSPGFPVCR